MRGSVVDKVGKCLGFSRNEIRTFKRRAPVVLGATAGLLAIGAYMEYAPEACDGEVVASQDVTLALRKTGLTASQIGVAFGRISYCDGPGSGQRDHAILSSIEKHGGERPVPSAMIVNMVDGEPTRTTAVVPK